MLAMEHERGTPEDHPVDHFSTPNLCLALSQTVVCVAQSKRWTCRFLGTGNGRLLTTA